MILASLVTGSLVMLAVSAWHLRKHREVEVFKHSARIAVIVLLPAILIQMFVGNKLGEIEAKYQPVEDRRGRGPMEQLPAVLVLAVSDRRRQERRDPDEDHRDPPPALVPRDGTFSGAVEGLNQLQKQYQHKYGPG